MAFFLFFNYIYQYLCTIIHTFSTWLCAPYPIYKIVVCDHDDDIYIREKLFTLEACGVIISYQRPTIILGDDSIVYKQYWVVQSKEPLPEFQQYAINNLKKIVNRDLCNKAIQYIDIDKDLDPERLLHKMVIRAITVMVQDKISSNKPKYESNDKVYTYLQKLYWYSGLNIEKYKLQLMKNIDSVATFLASCSIHM
jgi:hypothetical protein